VVPVVGLVEGVVKSANSKRWEYIPGSEISAMVANGWNGRPVLPDHPQVDGNYVLANNPDILEKYRFGELFNTSTSDEKLTFEAWLDADRASVVGPDAVSVVERAKAGQPIEISIGALMEAEEKSGTFDGKPYDAIWRNIVGDHLAMLQEGRRGACNNDMGCGAPRFAAEEFQMADTNETDDKKKTLRERLMSLITFKSGKAEADTSDSDLRSMLSQALRAVEPGYMGIDSVFPNEKLVVYAVMPKDEFQLFRRSYEVNSGEVKLAKEKEEVKPVTRYEPLSEAAPAPCGCRNNAEGEQNMKTKAERVKALIDNPKMKLAKESQAALEASPDTVIDSLEQAAVVLEAGGGTAREPEGEKGGDKSGQSSVSSNPAQQGDKSGQTGSQTGSETDATRHNSSRVLSMEEFLASAPPELRDGFRATAAFAKEHKAAAIKVLKESKRCDYSDAELEAMDVVALEKMAKLVGATVPATGRVDYMPQGVRSNVGETQEETVPDPPDFYQDIRVAAAGTKK